METTLLLDCFPANTKLDYSTKALPKSHSAPRHLHKAHVSESAVPKEAKHANRSRALSVQEESTLRLLELQYSFLEQRTPVMRLHFSIGIFTLPSQLRPLTILSERAPPGFYFIP